MISTLVYGEQGTLIKDIKVEGLQRIAPGTVFNYLPIKVGDRLTENSAQNGIRTLYKTGFFSDIQLKRDAGVLIVVVRERPSINSITITGSSDISEEDLKAGLKNVGLAEGRVFNRSLLEKIENELKRQYFSRGRYSVKVETTVTPLERNRVSIIIDVKEGLVAKIREIGIVGNKAFDEDDIVDEMSLSEPGYFTFLTRNDQYSREKLVGDQEAIKNLYRNNGYVEFNIESTQVSISPDKESIYITLNLLEGKKYKVTGYKIAGKETVPHSELDKLIQIKAGDVYSRKKVNDSVKAITDYLGRKGYAFANVNPIPDLNKDNGEVTFTFFVDPGKRVYVRRINFFGNAVTKDEVLRREMRQLEGAWFSTDYVNRSRVRLQRLGFFDSVNIETPQVTGTSDQIDVNVTVVERPTGNLLFGVGYSDLDGPLVNGSITESNLFGTGKELRASFNNSSSTKYVNLRYVNPYYTQSGILRGFNIFAREVDAARANTAPYVLSSAGAGTFFRFPISEKRSLRAGLSVEKNSITVGEGDSGAQVAQDFVETYGESNIILKSTLGWSYDSLNSAIFPVSGTLQRITIEVSVPGSELEYYKANYIFGQYIPIIGNITFRMKGELDYGDGYGGTEALPFYKNYFAGGSNTVRGYRSRYMGPRDENTDQPIGGSSRILGNLELFFPLPGADPENKAMRLSLFADAGMVYGPEEKIDTTIIRYSAGMALTWFSPIGPLSLSYGVPLNDEPDDKTEKFQFTIGVPLR
ncbi:MAG: outer membrane protein assembly factor BamA [Gammaproteobacteria bacterium]|nr:MAG: outer membrane protein assembly factor BamA [Gammaproteobacteria bacterium]